MPNETRKGNNINTSSMVDNNADSSPIPDTTHEFNSFYYAGESPDKLSGMFRCDILSAFTPEQIKLVLSDPITNHSLTRQLAMFVYNTEGVVTNAIDYMVALPCLDRVVYGKNKSVAKGQVEKNKELMLSVLESINDKQFIRDVLFTDMNEGTSFYYFETTSKPVDRTRFMNDYDVENITELCDVGLNAVMIPLPYEYCKIVGRKNGRYVIAFDLKYFDELESESAKERKMKKMPVEISKAYEQWTRNGKSASNWVVLDNDHTIAHKIKSKTSEPWGRPLAIAAIPDILYKNEFVDTKRNILREINSEVIIQTFPEGKDKGSCALTRAQQEDQHNKVKNAVMTKHNRGGTTFVSVAAGTKLDTLKINNTDLFDDKYENGLTDDIALDIGMAASLLNGSGSGNYSSQQNNLELINAQIYTWVHEIESELNYVINACIIKAKRNKVQVYYLPTSLVNRQKFFDMMKQLYLDAGGSYTYLVASSGISPEAYFNILDEEVDAKIFDKYQAHQTSYTQSSKDNSDDSAGRPTIDDPTNSSTIQTRANGSNSQPKPSTD